MTLYRYKYMYIQYDLKYRLQLNKKKYYTATTKYFMLDLILILLTKIETLTQQAYIFWNKPESFSRKSAFSS